MIKVPVRDEDFVEALEAAATLQNLALGALAAIHQKAVLLMHHKIGSQPAMHGWGRGRGSKKQDFKHDESSGPEYSRIHRAVMPGSCQWHYSLAIVKFLLWYHRANNFNKS